MTTTAPLSQTALLVELEPVVARNLDRHLAAARYGVASRSQAHRASIAGYDAAALGEIGFLVDRITESVRAAAVVTHCGRQIVLAPGAVCR